MTCSASEEVRPYISLPMLSIHWLSANFCDSLISLLGFTRGHAEANPLLASLGSQWGPASIIAWKWLVVMGFLLAIYLLRLKPGARLILERAMAVASLIVWLGVGWNFLVVGFAA